MQVKKVKKTLTNYKSEFYRVGEAAINEYLELKAQGYEFPVYSFKNGNKLANGGHVVEEEKISEKELNQFIDYVNGFYGKEGVYEKDFANKGFTKAELTSAVSNYIIDVNSRKDPDYTWGGGDSLDRERVRGYLESNDFKYGGDIGADDRITAKNWWNQTLSINEQKKFLIYNAPKHSLEFIKSYPTSAHSHLMENIYNEGDDTILNIWKKEGSPKYSEWLEKKYGYGDLTDKNLSMKIYYKMNPEYEGFKENFADGGVINHIGGYNYSEKENQTAKKVDLITLPKSVEGTNCSNCMYVKILDANKGLGFCTHKEIQLPVTARMCCSLWNAEGSLRSWEHRMVQGLAEEKLFDVRGEVYSTNQILIKNGKAYYAGMPIIKIESESPNALGWVKLKVMGVGNFELGIIVLSADDFSILENTIKYKLEEGGVVESQLDELYKHIGNKKTKEITIESNEERIKYEYEKRTEYNKEGYYNVTKKVYNNDTQKWEFVYSNGSPHAWDVKHDFKWEMNNVLGIPNEQYAEGGGVGNKLTIKYKGFIPYVADSYSHKFNQKATLLRDYSDDTVVNENGRTTFKEPKLYSYGYLKTGTSLGTKRGWVLNLPQKGVSMEMEYHPQKFEEVNDLYWVFEGRVFSFPEDATIHVKPLTEKNQDFRDEHNLGNYLYGHGKKDYVTFDGDNAAIDMKYDSSIQKSNKYYAVYFGDDKDGLYEKGLMTHSLPNAYLYARQFDVNEALLLIIENGKVIETDMIYPYSDSTDLQEIAKDWLESYYGNKMAEGGGVNEATELLEKYFYLEGLDLKYDNLLKHTEEGGESYKELWAKKNKASSEQKELDEKLKEQGVDINGARTQYYMNNDFYEGKFDIKNYLKYFQNNKFSEGGRVDMDSLQMDLKSIKAKYPNAKVSYTFAKDSSGKGYVITAKEGKKVVYSSYKMRDGGGVDNDFDWMSLFAEETEEQKSQRLSEQEKSLEQQREEEYQKSKFSKKWASTFKEAVNKTVKEYLSAKDTYDDWGSREYKANKGSVWVGEELGGTSMNLGRINENRRQKTLRGSKMVMDESIEALKELGLTETEIQEVLGQNKMAEGGEVGGNYSFENQLGSFTTIKVMPIDENLRVSHDFFSVQVTVRAKKGEDVIIQKKPLVTYPISKYNDFIKDLEGRGNIKKMSEGGGIKKSIIAHNNTNSAYDRDAQKLIIQYLKNLNDSGRNVFIKSLEKLGQNYNDYDVFFYVNQSYHPKHSDKFYSNKLVYRKTIEEAYKDALNSDDESPDFIRVWKKDGVTNYIAVPQASLFGDYIGDMYNENGNLKQEVKDLSINILKNGLTPTNKFEEGGGIETNEALVNELKNNIEQKTGVKVSVKFNKTGSMRGYVSFSPRSKGGAWVDFPFDILQQLRLENAGQEPHPNFYSKSGIDIYIGNEVFNKPERKCKTCDASIPVTHHYCESCKTKYATEKFEEGKNQFLGYTTNLGRAPRLGNIKGKVSGSGGWGYAPNYVDTWMPLTKENLDRSIQRDKIELKNGTILTREEAYKQAEQIENKFEEGGEIKYYRVEKEGRPVLKAKFGKSDDSVLRDMQEMLDNLADKNYVLKPITEQEYKEFDYSKVDANDISEFNKGREYFANGGVATEPESLVVECEKLYEEHHETWEKIDIIEKEVSQKNCNDFIEQILFIWESDMKPHFMDEEENFFPHISNEKNKHVIDELMLEHVEVVALIGRIKEHGNVDDVLKFCELIKNHIQKEEVLMTEVCPDKFKNGGTAYSIPEDLIEEGTKIEMEHKKTIEKVKQNPHLKIEDVARLIAIDHLKESPNYYKELIEMEKKLSEGGKIYNRY